MTIKKDKTKQKSKVNINPLKYGVKYKIVDERGYNKIERLYYDAFGLLKRKYPDPETRTKKITKLLTPLYYELLSIVSVVYEPDR